MGEVGAEEHPLDTDQLGKGGQVLLPEGTDVDAALDDGDLEVREPK
jgi:hypothetical protein